MGINLHRGFFSILFGRAGLLILTVLINPLLVRILGSSRYGEYTFIVSVVGVTTMIANFGIDDGMRKFVAEDRSDPSWGGRVFAFYVRLGIVLTGICTVSYVIIYVTGAFEYLVGSEFSRYIYLIILLVICRQVYSIGRSSLMGIGFEHVTEPLQVVRKLAFGVIGLGLSYASFGVAGVLVGHIVSTFIVAIVVVYVISGQFDLSLPLEGVTEKYPKKEFLSFNMYSASFILLSTSLYHADILLLQPIAGSTSTGYYKAALQIAQFLWFIPIALQTALLHSTSEIWSRDDQSEISTIAARVTRYAIVATLLLVIGLWALADALIPVYYGSEFSPAVVPLLLLLPGTLGFAIARPIYSIGQGKGNLRPLILASGLSALINLALNVIMIPRYGMFGAAVSTSIGYGSMLVFHGVVARRIGFDPFADLRVFRIAFTAVASVPFVFGLDRVITGNIASLLLVPPAGFVFYALAAIKTGAVDSDDVLAIARPLPSSLRTGLMDWVYRIE